MMMNDEEAHQLRKCKKCGEMDHWRRMEPHNETKYKIKGAKCWAGTSAEKHDVNRAIQYGELMYPCIACLRKRNGVELPEAMRHTKQKWTQISIIDYSDQWFKLQKGEGAFNVFYICCAGGAEWPCNTVIESQLWDRLQDELQASRQRWYCKCCSARYRTKFGVMVEIVIKGQPMYCHSELPPRDVFPVFQ